MIKAFETNILGMNLLRCEKFFSLILERGSLEFKSLQPETIDYINEAIDKL
jgi:hypothetical protein